MRVRTPLGAESKGSVLAGLGKNQGLLAACTRFCSLRLSWLLFGGKSCENFSLGAGKSCENLSLGAEKSCENVILRAGKSCEKAFVRCGKKSRKHPSTADSGRLVFCVFLLFYLFFREPCVPQNRQTARSGRHSKGNAKKPRKNLKLYSFFEFMLF